MTPAVNSLVLRQQDWQLADFPKRVGNLAAWHDASDASTISEATGVKLWGDKSGNSGANCLCSDGAASNTATSPDVSTTGSITFSFDVGLTDYTPAADRVLVNKLSGNDGHSITLLTTGVVRLRVGNGASVTNVDSTVALSLTDLARGQFTVIWTDGVGASFTQNGAALGTAVAAAVTMTNAAVANTLWALTAGRFYSYTCGTYTFNPSGAAKLATSFVAPGTGETWTINTSGNTGARIAGERDIGMMTAANQPIASVDAYGRLLTFDGTNDYLKSPAFSLAQPCTVYFVGSQVTWTLNDKLFDGNASNTMVLTQAAGSPNLYLFAGASVGPLAPSLALTTNGIVATVFNGAASVLRLNRNAPTTLNPGASNANGFTLGSVGSGTAEWANITVREILIYSAAHNQQTQDKVAQYLGRKWSIAV